MRCSFKEIVNKDRSKSIARGTILRRPYEKTLVKEKDGGETMEGKEKEEPLRKGAGQREKKG